MKRFHVHLHVNDIAENVAFYSALFNQPPARAEGDYAKWMLEDPPVNFAISTRGNKAGLDHLGIQVGTAEELTAMKSQAQSADMALLDEGETTCCYARSDKHWITDPQGVAWEQFHTLDSIPVYSEASVTEGTATACCAPGANAQASANPAAGASCCAPAANRAPSGCC